MVFPWDSSDLNQAFIHADVIDACEGIVGNKKARRCEAILSTKYTESYADGTTPGTVPGAFHQDYANTTLAPFMSLQKDDFQHITCIYFFDDVEPGMAPMQD